MGLVNLVYAMIGQRQGQIKSKTESVIFSVCFARRQLSRHGVSTY